tara:strand:+ start:447 stop:629 length:183 start_codon:yes stop_codon:yes gene_type:complete
MNKLTKKEQEFLLDWLSDDLHIELEKEKSDFPNPIARSLLPKIILKLKQKLTTKTRSKNG